jgi:hypothetical protein
VSNIVLGQHTGTRRLRRVGPLLTAAALSASLLAASAGPANATVREPARTAPISVELLADVAQDTTVTVVPGVTLTIGDAGIELSLTKQAVTEVENVVGFGQNVASLVGSILSVALVPQPGPQIAALVASALGVGTGLLRLCSASDGSASFTIRWFGLPSCSGLGLTA